jgi:hypothetical protein
MSAHDNGGPAFPANHFDLADGEHGMTLRDYFAAKALPAHMAALSTMTVESPAAWHAEMARLAYATADAMLKARQA